jgi:predicted nucleotidyltransferase
MRQLELIKLLPAWLESLPTVQSAVLFGSFARGEGNANSDVDVAVLGEPDNLLPLLELAAPQLGMAISKVIRVQMRSKIVVYFQAEHFRLEIMAYRDLEEFHRNYIGSAIPLERVGEIILLDRTGEFLTQLLQGHSERVPESIEALVNKFLYEFEAASSYHRRSDGYRFQYFYQIALHVHVQLLCWLHGDSRFDFLPRYIMPALGSDETRKRLYALSPTMYLPEANGKKKALADWFTEVLNELKYPDAENIAQWLEHVIERDYFWNFRDASLHVSLIKPRRLYRTATLSLFQNDEKYKELVAKKGISTIIDLRADREVSESSYSEDWLKDLRYVRAPLDPWNQPDWFREKYHYGTNEDIAYRFFLLGCKPMIRAALTAIAENDGPCAIHCFAGKDRTGIVMCLIHLLISVPEEQWMTDYLASEVDMKPERMKELQAHVEREGGIRAYLRSCEMTDEQIDLLINRLTHE